MVERIVIVDDEEGILALLRRVLRAPGREIEVYPNVATALAAMRRARPDLVITDLNMPGMSGYDFIRAVREEFGPTLGVVVITAFPTMVSDADAVENGVGAYLRKPFTDLDLLRSTVAEVIEASRRLPDAAMSERFRRHLAAADTAARRQRAGLSRADAVLDQISDAILIADRAGRLLQVNPAAARLLGVNGEECLGRPLRELDVDPQLRSAILDLMPDDDAERRTVGLRVFLEASGRTCDVTTGLLVNVDGGAAGIFAVVKDVSAEVRVHELKHHYLTVLAHELRTPITSLTNFAAVFERLGFVPMNSRQQQLVTGVRRQVERLEHQVDKLILLARLERGDFTARSVPFAVGPVIEQGLAACQADAAERGIAFTIAVQEQEGAAPIVASGDADDFRRAVYEVGENAVKFTQNGGRVSVTVETDSADVIVRVTDTGIGIDRHDLHAIFAPFKQLEDPLTRRHTGAGLGLGLARRMLEAVGGRIDVTSAPARGSTFSLRVPRASREARALPASVPISRGGAGGGRASEERPEEVTA